MTKVLLVDRSGRGHALADLFTRTCPDVVVHYAPGCAAAAGPRLVPLPELGLADPRPMVDHARRQGVDFVFVANAQALADGFVDAFRAAGLPVVGPDRAASRLESSKVYAKDLFERYGIPTPEHRVFRAPETAREHVRRSPHALVVKADGLCGGNGAFVCDDAAQALRAVDRLMVEKVFGAAGERVVIERRVAGPEVSFFAFLDGEGYVALPMARDYPKSDDGGGGVTSGGMGAISPHPLERPELRAALEGEILQPLLRLIREEELRFIGAIYLGCILVEGRPQLLEVNARLGDPEAEVVLPRLEDDFVELCGAMLAGGLDGRQLRTNDLAFCDVVATQGPTPAMHAGDPPGGYPGWPFGAVGRHYPIHGLEDVDPGRCRVFLGEATVLPSGELVSDGGRVVHVVGCGPDLATAVRNSYDNIGRIRFLGMRYRTDIGGTQP
jgi:phosphoribosylamine--glycine ligase